MTQMNAAHCHTELVEVWACRCDPFATQSLRSGAHRRAIRYKSALVAPALSRGSSLAGFSLLSLTQNARAYPTDARYFTAESPLMRVRKTTMRTHNLR